MGQSHSSDWYLDQRKYSSSGTGLSQSLKRLCNRKEMKKQNKQKSRLAQRDMWKRWDITQFQTNLSLRLCDGVNLTLTYIFFFRCSNQWHSELWERNRTRVQKLSGGELWDLDLIAFSFWNVSMFQEEKTISPDAKIQLLDKVTWMNENVIDILIVKQQKFDL